MSKTVEGVIVDEQPVEAVVEEVAPVEEELRSLSFEDQAALAEAERLANPVDEQPVEDIAEAATISIADIEAALLLEFPPEPEKEPYVPPKGATWEYSGSGDTKERGVPDEWVWERLRNKRNALLAASDAKVSIPDAPWDTAPWLAYRQALRDLPAGTLNPRKAVWPAEPT